MKWNKVIQIADRKIGIDQPTYIIAEIGSNHNQSLDFAFESIDAAASAGVDAVKFQSLKFDELYAKKSAPKGIEQLFEQIHLEESWHEELSNYAASKNVHFFSAPAYPKAVDVLARINCPVVKIASPQFGFYPEVLDASIAYAKPIIFSAGLSSIGEIDQVMRYCQTRKFYDAVLLHCVSQYPTRPEQANINMIGSYKKMFGCLVGYSDHTLGIHFPIAAVAKGACVVEKHFTLDKALDGPDHHFAIEPLEMEQMVQVIRDIEVGLGTGIKAPLTDWEVDHRNRITMRFVAARDINAGENVGLIDLKMRRADHGLVRDDSKLFSSSVCTAVSDIEEGEVLELTMLNILGEEK